jgi:hypothetical protein
MPSEKVNQVTRAEWRELGFFYDRDDAAKRWRLVGSKTGLQRFATALSQFASNPRNERQSEHEHLGPYMYLEIGSWPEPEITEHWIAGPLPALNRLSTEIRSRVPLAREDDVLLFRQSFSPGSPYELSLEVRTEAFDPASEDPQCW